MRVLIVEDNPDSALPLRLLLEMSGHVVQHASDAAEAIACIRKQQPDAVVCDLTLPDGDGTTVIRDIEPGPLCIAVTGHSRERVWEACSRAGFHHYLQKPVDFDALLALLALRP